MSIQNTFLGVLNLNRASSVGWHQMAAIHFVPPTMVRFGYIHFAIPGDAQRLRTFSQGAGSATTHPRAILFRWQNRHAYRQLRHLLVGATPGRYPPGQ